MSENNVESKLGSLHWLHGLEDYLEFTKEEDSKQFITFLLKLVYAEPPVASINEIVDSINFVETLKQFAHSPVLTVIHKYLRSGYGINALQDAFSSGQVQSKIWLATELAKIQKDFDNIFILAGWFGQLVNYMDVQGITYNTVRSFDIDPVACEVSDKIFNAANLGGFKVKSSELDVTKTDWINRTGCIYPITNYRTGEVIIEKSTPDLIINTSAEHFDENWYYKLSLRLEDKRPLFVIQTNDFFDIPEHVNCVHSLDEMKRRFLMKEILYEGELDLGKYKRFMMIGRA